MRGTTKRTTWGGNIFKGIAILEALVALMSAHIGRVVSGEQSPIRLFLMKIFARYIEMPLLRISYLTCRGRLGFISRLRIVRLLLLNPLAYLMGHYVDTGKPIPTDQLVDMIGALEGKIALGPCRCRYGHHSCGHPIPTDIVIRTGADVWLEEFPEEYEVVSKKEAIRIVEECASLGMFHMVFIHCMVEGAVNEYAICNCCADGCVPFILNRTLGQNIYPLVKGAWKASSGDPVKCTGCGVCVEFCPFSERKVVGGKSTVGDCFGCGLCYERCPNGAITLTERDA